MWWGECGLVSIENEPAARMVIGVAGSAFTSGLFAYGHFQLRNIDPDFGFTLGAVQREIVHYRIFAYFGSGLASTNGAVNPLCCLLLYIHVWFLSECQEKNQYPSCRLTTFPSMAFRVSMGWVV